MHNTEHGAHSTDAEVLEAAGVLSAHTIVRVKRLKYIRRLLCSDQKHLLYLVTITAVRDRTWLAAIVADMAWMKAQLTSKLEALPSPASDLSPWLELILSSYWAKLVHAAADVQDSSVARTVELSTLPCDTSAVYFFYECE